MLITVLYLLLHDVYLNISITLTVWTFILFGFLETLQQNKKERKTVQLVHSSYIVPLDKILAKQNFAMLWISNVCEFHDVTTKFGL